MSAISKQVAALRKEGSPALALTETLVTIWIVDDDFFLGSALAAELEQASNAVVQLYDVDEVVRERSEPAFVVLDVSLRGCDAIDVLQVLSTRKITAPIQILSGNAPALLEEIKALGQRRGLTMLPPLCKPVMPADVCTIVERELSSLAMSERLVIDVAPICPIEPVDLALAMDRGWTEVWYQPKYDIATGAIVGAECLSRVRHPARGVLPPAAFLPGAGPTDMALLTKKVIQQACHDWLDFEKAMRPIRLAVNVPGSFLTQLPLVRLLRELAPQSRRWSGLTFEITEEEALRDIDLVREISTQLKIYGVDLSIDDFGMGYSSFARLREIPFREIKLDRSLVQGCADDFIHGALCRSVIDLAHSFGASAVAEGVERSEDLAFLRTIRCDIAQGYLYARPMPKADFLTLLGEN